VDPRAGLDDMEKRKFLTLPGLELRPFGRPARSQSLYWLRYKKFMMHKYITLCHIAGDINLCGRYHLMVPLTIYYTRTCCVLFFFRILRQRNVLIHHSKQKIRTINVKMFVIGIKGDNENSHTKSMRVSRVKF
jgi:hypothetical protein